MNKEFILARAVSQIVTGLNLFVDDEAQMAKQLVSVPYPPATTSAHDAGRPPHKRSGNLQEHIRAVHAEVQGLTITAGIAVPLDQVPYARRLELGFVGTDSLGRRYNDPPKPFMTPTQELMGPQLPDYIARAV